VSRRETEVVVSGAGPVGLFAALSLAGRGVGVEILDEQTQTTGRSYALALHPRSLELLDELGLAEELVSRGHRIDALAFHEGDRRRAELRYGALSSKFPFLLVLPQAVLEEGLETRLRERRVRVLWNHRLAQLRQSADDVVAEVERLSRESAGYSVQTTVWAVDKVFELQARLALGADGHRSVVRRRLGVEFPETGPSELFAVFEFIADRPCPPEAAVVLDADTTSVVWPIGANRYRWNLQIPEAGVREERRAKSPLSVLIGDQSFGYLDPALLQELLAARAPWFDAKPKDIAWSLALRFERRTAASFGIGRAWLAGDSAHLGGPVAMQSMNVGLCEAAEWAAHATTMLRGGPDRMETHGRECRARWDGHAEPAVEAAGTADPWVRDRAARIAGCVPASGAHLWALLGQVGLRSRMKNEG